MKKLYLWTVVCETLSAYNCRPFFCIIPVERDIIGRIEVEMCEYVEDKTEQSVNLKLEMGDFETKVSFYD